MKRGQAKLLNNYWRSAGVRASSRSSGSAGVIESGLASKTRNGFVRCFLLMGMLTLLAACIDNKTNTTATVVAPVNGLDFPFGAQIFATDGGDLDISGLAIATTPSGVVQQIALAIDDGGDEDPVVLPPLVNADGNQNFYWRLDSLAPESLPLGLSALSATASFGEFSTARSALLARGSSWMWQAAIQFYDDPNSNTRRWLILDTARRGLIEIDLLTGEQLEPPISINGDGNVVAMDKPVDFIIDGDRALVVDRQLAAIIAIDLADGSRSILSDATTPNADAPLLEPVAIELDTAGGIAYVVDQGRRNLLQINLADGARSVFTVTPIVTPAIDDQPERVEPELVLPLDIVHQPAGTNPVRAERLLVSDAKANAVIAIDIASGNSQILLSPGDADDAAVPETFFYSQINRLALEGDTLYVTDSGLFFDPSLGFLTGAVAQVDVSGIAANEATGDGDGNRTLLSTTGAPDFNNSFRSPQALAFNASDPLDLDDPEDRLLVLDNQLGVIVAVEVSETVAEEVDPPVSLGRRSYLPGGASLDQQQIDDGVSTRALGLAADFSEVTLSLPVATLTAGAGIFVLDAAQNAVFTLDLLSGARGRIDQALGGADGDTEAEQEAAEAAFENTRFDRPSLIQSNASGSGVLVVDQYDDTLISVPLPFIDSTSVREVASASDLAQPLDDPRAMVVYLESLAEGDTAIPEELLYVLNGSGIVQIDLAVEADPESNRIAYDVAAAGCSLGDPAELLIRTTVDADGVTDSAHLVVVEANAKTMHIINRIDDVCTSVNYTYDGGGIIAADIDIVDVQIVGEDSDTMLTTLLLLDRGNRAVVSLELDIEAATFDDAATVLSSTAQPLNGANALVSPLALGYDANVKRAYVFDDVLRSVYIIDVAERLASSGRRLTQCDVDPADTAPDECQTVNVVPAAERTITGQRLVLSRGTSLNCQPVADCAL